MTQFTTFFSCGEILQPGEKKKKKKQEYCHTFLVFIRKKFQNSEIFFGGKIC
jgi:hypothetical protein